MKFLHAIFATLQLSIGIVIVPAVDAAAEDAAQLPALENAFNAAAGIEELAIDKICKYCKFCDLCEKCPCTGMHGCEHCDKCKYCWLCAWCAKPDEASEVYDGNIGVPHDTTTSDGSEKPSK